jgi:hypothetical protein
VAAILDHAGTSDRGGRHAADLAVVIRTHLAYLCVTVFCAVAAALLAIIVLGGLLGGGPRNGLLYYVMLLAAVSFLTCVPYTVRRWWHLTTTGCDDWIFD